MSKYTITFIDKNQIQTKLWPIKRLGNTVKKNWDRIYLLIG